MNTEYQKLHEISKKGTILEGIFSILDWDRETFMPIRGAEIRAQQLSALSGLIHQNQTSHEFRAALEYFVNISNGNLTKAGQSLDPKLQASVQRWHRDYVKKVSIPSEFVKSFTQLTSEATIVWRRARQENQFSLFEPYLEKIVDLSRKKAEYLGYQDHPYDALLDEYEPNFPSKEIAKLFDKLRPQITQLLQQIMSAKKIEDQFLYGQFDKEKQMEIADIILQAMGYDLNKGRLDLSTHPFSSSSHPHDSRITTRIHPKLLMSSIRSVLHEAGHSLYEMGLPVEHYGSPLCQAISLGFHESQSRWWEIYIGTSYPFWYHFFPLLQKLFPVQLGEISLEGFYRAINQVSPSLIRVEADEVTYNLHVILRFELERGLIEGSLKVKDIPEVWNAKMKQFLGISPENDREGCLQDVHWSGGAFGYFPTYTLGNLYAGHLFSHFKYNVYPNWEQKVQQGELIFIKQWLQEEIHQHGRRYDSLNLLKNITKVDFTEQTFMSHLKEKYSQIYNLKI